MKKVDYYPGWKMTRAQYRKYWNLVRAAYRAYCATTLHDTGATVTQDSFRALLHARAFGRNISAKEIDRMKMFGDFKGVCLDIITRGDFETLLANAQANEPKTNIIHRILTFPCSYTLELLNGPRFRSKIQRLLLNSDRAILEDLQDMAEKDLKDLRNTLCARNPISSACAGLDKTSESVRYAGTTEHPGKCVSNQSDRAGEQALAENPF